MVERFLENVNWQYFCGFEYFQHELPIDPSSLTRWRQGVGADGMEKLLKQTIETAKRAKRETKRLKIYRGRVRRDIERKVANLHRQLELAQRLLKQQRQDKGKLYSIHAPEVEGIAKGKAHKRYEFGCKVAMVSTSRDNWIVGIDAVPGNPYDGHTLEASLQQAKRVSGWQPGSAYCDRGYRGYPGTIDGTVIHIAGRRQNGISGSAWRWFKRRAAIEPMFSHLKAENRMDRNHLKGKEGDRSNALLSGCGYNIRKLLRAFLLLIFKWLFFDQKRQITSSWSAEPLMIAA